MIIAVYVLIYMVIGIGLIMLVDKIGRKYVGVYDDFQRGNEYGLNDELDQAEKDCDESGSPKPLLKLVFVDWLLKLIIPTVLAWPIMVPISMWNLYKTAKNSRF